MGYSDPEGPDEIGPPPARPFRRTNWFPRMFRPSRSSIPTFGPNTLGCVPSNAPCAAASIHPRRGRGGVSYVSTMRHTIHRPLDGGTCSISRWAKRACSHTPDRSGHLDSGRHASRHNRKAHARSAPRPLQPAPGIRPGQCSVCKEPFGDREPLQAWIFLPVATDVLPLLVHACSQRCLQSLPSPPEGYVPHYHRGGLGLSQPERRP